MSTIDPSLIRNSILSSLPAESSHWGKAPEPRHVYVPPAHMKALRLETNLVIGARGVGKSFWSAALASDKVLTLIKNYIRDFPSVRVATGFSEREDVVAYPDAATIQSLLTDAEPFEIWRAVIARWLAAVVSESIPVTSWAETLKWVHSEPEAFARIRSRAEAYFEGRDEHGLIVFDALDKSAYDWPTMDRLTRDLLRVVLSLKPFRRLHCKVFLREDQFVNRQVTDFPDASKLLSTRVDLTWGRDELNGLLWQYLVNGDGNEGQSLRSCYESVVGHTLSQTEGVWGLHDSVRREESIQKALFATLAGDYMGKDRRRGIPYTWTIGHLADGHGFTSPRSYLAGIRVAAEDTATRYPSHTLPLHYESIKRGVQKASEIRVTELAEDYPWVKVVLGPLRGLTVPCSYSAMEERWLQEIGAQFQTGSGKLPPEHADNGWPGIRQDLQSLGIFQKMKDGRINMPDLYRVGFGLGRRGGVKPVQRSTTA